MMKSKLRPNATLAKFFPRSFMLAIFLTGSCEAYAQVVSPMQGGHYTMGLMNMRDLATPAPGLYMVLYNQYLWSEGFFDRNGNKINSITVNPGPNPGPGPGVTLDVNTDVSAFASVPVVMWAAKERVLGARYFTQVGLPFLAADASVGAEHSGGAILPASGKVATSHVSGFSDIMFSPVGLSWGLPPLDFTFLYTVYAPSGQYKVGGGNNTGLGFWTQQLQSFAYFYPGGSRNTALMVGMNL